MPTRFDTLNLLFVSLAAFSSSATSATESHHHVLHSFQRQELSDVYFSEGASAGDINGDGQSDVVYGPHWYEGPSFKTAHEIYPAVPQNRKGYADQFFSWVYDFDGNGDNDVLTVGFPGKPGYVYRNPGKGELSNLWEKTEILDSVANESPQFADITGDGIPELICTRKGHYGFAQFNQANPFAAWAFVSISDAVAPNPFGHGLGTGDVNSDGRIDVIAQNGWFEQPATYAANDNWKFHPVNFAPAASDMFAYDVDGDGDNDIITCLHAHEYGLAWYENAPGDNNTPTFTQHLIMGTKTTDSPYGVLFTELHAVKMADINGDGLQDIVTGKTYWSHHTGSPMWDAGAVVYWFELHRDGNGNVEFIPHKADGEAGIGRGLFVGDINNDKLPDIVTGGMKGAHVLTHHRREVTHEEYEVAQPKKRPTMAAGLTPEAAAKNMTVPPGFKVQLAAGEPMIHQPIAMCFDDRGRLWAAEGHTYPQRAKDGEGKDRIVIFEDEDGDGTFDTSKTFIEGLNLVSGLEVGFGGVYVGAAPYLMFIPDADGDDKPDAPAKNDRLPSVQFPNDVPAGATVLLDGFGWHDTHETLNAFIWGPDGWLYGCHGVFTHSKVGKPETPEAERQGLNCGVWRYHPAKHEFEVFSSGTSNPWGVDFNDNGQAFITACVIPHLWHMVQGGRYHRQGGRHFNPHTYDDIKTIADHSHYVGNIRDHAWWGHEPKAAGGTAEAGGGHAHAGAMIYLGDNWPDEYRNQIYFSNIHGNRINNDLLNKSENSSGYVGHHGKDFLFANDHYYRGINLRYGPDGSVYLIDWYDKNACHRNNPEIWDRSNGRIFRISYGTPNPPDNIAAGVSSWALSKLLSAHDHKNEWYVRMARKSLMQRQHQQPDAIPSRFLNQLWTAAADFAKPADRRLRYLWTLNALGGLSDEKAMQSLTDKEEYVRAWTVQLLMEDHKASPQLVQQMTMMAANDTSAVVRLYLASALQRLPLQERWAMAENLASHAKDVNDHNIPLVLWYGIEPLVPTDAKRALELALRSQIPLLQRYIVRRAAVQNDTVNSVVDTLNTTSDEAIQQLILDEMLAAVEGRVDVPMPVAWKLAYAKVSKMEPQSLRDKADQLAVTFGDQRVFPKMRALLSDSDMAAERRLKALAVLVKGQDKASAELLFSDSVLKNEQLQGAAVRALSSIGDDRTPNLLLKAYSTLTRDARHDVISTLVSRPAWTEALLQSIGAKTVAASDLHAFHVRQILAFKNDSLNALLKENWGEVRETNADRKQQIAKWKTELSPKRMKSANLGNGRRIFTKTCQNCHRLFGTGGAIGPDITGSNRANQDYLLENILDPSAVVGRNYQMLIVALESGQVISGLLKNETDSAITIQTINDKVVVPKNQIDERSLSKVSMMPERQLDALSKDEARDLMAYLASPFQVAISGPPAPIDPKTGKVPGAMEAENMKVVEKSAGNVRNQAMGSFRKGKWSGNSHLWWTGAKPGSQLALEVPVATDGTYTIEMAFTKAHDYGVIKVSIDGQVLEDGLDLYNKPDVVATGTLSYAGVKLAKGNHRLQIEIVGAHPKATKAHMVGLDYIRLAP